MRLGLALSGGGFRAASFHLGVLKRMDELGLLSRVSVLSTVSGGAIVGALYALRCSKEGNGSPGSFPVSDLIAEIRPHLTSNLRGVALFGRPERALRTIASFVVPGVHRMPLVVDRLNTVFYAGSRVSQLPSWILISATNLRTGKSWKFFNDRAGDYLAGATEHTDDILVAEAVGASAAYPVLVDPYPFHTRWEDLRADLLDENRWQRPASRAGGHLSRWRSRYGKPEGEVTFPLVDGGLYDNEGLNGLRGAAITHAIISNASPAEGDLIQGNAVRVLARTIDVMHARLGSSTRQLAHEMTHGFHPNTARTDLRKIAIELRAIADQSPSTAEELTKVAAQLDLLSAVGWPPRGHQFTETSQILLNSSAIARNESARYEDPFDIPYQDRGLDEPLVEEVSRVRTDLDALEPDVFDLLVAQGYFLADAYLRTGVPSVIRECSGGTNPTCRQLRPSWDWAYKVIADANAHSLSTTSLLRKARRSNKLWGRCERTSLRLRLVTSALLAGACFLVPAMLLCFLLFALINWLLHVS